MNLISGAAFTGVHLAETGFGVRSRRRNRPRAGPAKNKPLPSGNSLFNFVVPMTVLHGWDLRPQLVFHTPNAKPWVICASYRMSHSMGSV